jgi:hypothetical protein
MYKVDVNVENEFSNEKVALKKTLILIGRIVFNGIMMVLGTSSSVFKATLKYGMKMKETEKLTTSLRFLKGSKMTRLPAELKMAGPITNRLGARFLPNSNRLE